MQQQEEHEKKVRRKGRVLAARAQFEGESPGDPRYNFLRRDPPLFLFIQNERNTVFPAL